MLRRSGRPRIGCFALVSKSRSVKHKFLQNGIRRASASTDRRATEDQADAALGVRIVGVGDCSGGEIAADIGIVDFAPPVVAVGDKWAQQRVAQAGTGCACSPEVITRILMKQGGQYGVADEDICVSARE